jgi:hypothetical protein
LGGLRDQFHLACRRNNLNSQREPQLNTQLFRPPITRPQLDLGLKRMRGL